MLAPLTDRKAEYTCLEAPCTKIQTVALLVLPGVQETSRCRVERERVECQVLPCVSVITIRLKRARSVL